MPVASCTTGCDTDPSPDGAGDGRGAARDVIEHEFLARVDPTALLAYALEPPWRPTIEDDNDLSNFADIYDDDSEDEDENYPFEGDETWNF